MEGIIKYRAWRKQTNEMFNVQSIAWDSDGEMRITLKEYSERSRNTTYPEDEVELMQFTGLTDKNGVKIFEGDVLTYTDVYSKVLLPVSFFNGKFMKQEIRPDSHKWLHTSDHWFDLSFAHERNEVIGNIHEKITKK